LIEAGGVAGVEAAFSASGVPVSASRWFGRYNGLALVISRGGGGEPHPVQIEAERRFHFFSSRSKMFLKRAS
jgi:hypothetical protein